MSNKINGRGQNGKFGFCGNLIEIIDSGSAANRLYWLRRKRDYATNIGIGIINVISCKCRRSAAASDGDDQPGCVGNIREQQQQTFHPIDTSLTAKAVSHDEQSDSHGHHHRPIACQHPSG